MIWWQVTQHGHVSTGGHFTRHGHVSMGGPPGRPPAQGVTRPKHRPAHGLGVPLKGGSKTLPHAVSSGGGAWPENLGHVETRRATEAKKPAQWPGGFELF